MLSREENHPPRGGKKGLLWTCKCLRNKSSSAGRNHLLAILLLCHPLGEQHIVLQLNNALFPLHATGKEWELYFALLSTLCSVQITAQAGWSLKSKEEF